MLHSVTVTPQPQKYQQCVEEKLFGEDCGLDMHQSMPIILAVGSTSFFCFVSANLNKKKWTYILVFVIKIYIIFYRDILFDIYKSEIFFVMIYFGINYNISEIL